MSAALSLENVLYTIHFRHRKEGLLLNRLLVCEKKAEGTRDLSCTERVYMIIETPNHSIFLISSNYEKREYLDAGW